MPEVQGERKPEAVQIAQSLDADDVLVLGVEGVAEILTENRLELVDLIRNEEPESIRALARAADRNVNAVMRDVKKLYETDVIAFKEEGNRKRPVLRHDAVVVEPLM